MSYALEWALLSRKVNRIMKYGDQLATRLNLRLTLRGPYNVRIDQWIHNEEHWLWLRNTGFKRRGEWFVAWNKVNCYIEIRHWKWKLKTKRKTW